MKTGINTTRRRNPMAVKVPKALSPGEEAFALYCREVFHPVNLPTREFVFAHPRKWRFDFAWPHKKLAVEIEGGVWTAGRHTRGTGYEADLDKYNTAVLMGWRVLRFTTAMVNSGRAMDQVLAALK